MSLLAHREAHREVRHGAGPEPRTNTFTQEDLLRMNEEHDRKMGWSPQFASLYTNPNRHPETHLGPPETLWQK